MIIRAVSEVECEGHLDRMNAYDNAFVSFGPFHWVLGLTDKYNTKVTDGGEVSSFIAFLKEKDRAAYDKAFGFFGLDSGVRVCRVVDKKTVCQFEPKSWDKSGNDFFYSGGIRNYGKGRPVMKRGAGTVSLTNDKAGLDFGNYLRSWHWFYRFVMAARTVSGFTRYVWDFARLRIRDIRSITIKKLGFTDSAGNPKDPTIGEIFTSERAFALVLRLHVRYPAHVADLNNKTTGLRNILNNSLAQMKKEGLQTKDFANWGQRHQDILIENIVANYSVGTGIRKTLTPVRDFAFQSNSLSTAPNSFDFNQDGLSGELPTY